jgi:two-component system sensor histidine kinase RegB
MWGLGKQRKGMISSLTLDTAQPPKDAELGMLRLRTLVRLRWLAVTGQTAAVLGVYFLLGFPLPIGLCLAAITLSAWLNIFLTIRWRRSVRLQPPHAGLLLAYDILQLAMLLYLTGGLENPFAFLFLVPVTISATSLPLKWTLWLGAIAFLCASFLAIDHLPLPWTPNLPLVLPNAYIAGMWSAIVCGVVFSALYARRIAEEARQMSAALSATEMVLAREQRLSALDGFAAAAAHELGTPLATIALVAKELKREVPASDPHTEDIDLLVSQAGRCREILARLASRDAETDEIYQRTKMLVMIEDLIAPLRGSDVEITVTSPASATDPGNPEPVFRRNPAIAYGLGNLLENAADFAATKVGVEARWTATSVAITVSDDGPGFHQDVFDRLGDPFVTTRPGYGAEPEEGGHEGMGLGFFIAKTLLERSGAVVSLANRPAPRHGAVVQVVWPRTVIDVGRLEPGSRAA